MALLSALSMGAAIFLQVRFFLKKETSPSIVTWSMFWVAVTISFLTFFRTHEGGLVTNITNTTDMVGVSVMIVVLAVWGGKDAFQFEASDLLCFLGLGMILTYWFVYQNDWATNLATQSILTLAYIPTFVKMWRKAKAGRKSESAIAWSCTLSQSLTGLAVARMDGGFLSTIYAGRSTILIATLLGFTAYLRRRYPRNIEE